MIKLNPIVNYTSVFKDSSLISIVRLFKICILFFIFSLGSVHSQVSFYASLSRDYKISFNEVQYNNQKSSDYLTFPDFKIYQSSRTFDQPKRLAIGLGMVYKRHRVSFAWQNDGVSNKSHVAVRAYNFVGNTYRYDAFRGTGRSSQSRLSLNYDFQLFQRDKKTSVFISTSLGLCYRAGPKGIGPVGSIGAGGNLAPNKAITVNYSSFTDVAKYVVNFGAGIGVDLYAKKYYLFTLSANFTYSNRNLYYTENTVSVFNNTSSQDYNFKTKALCSGIYFGISRRFQFYPWKPIKDYPIWDQFHSFSEGEGNPNN